MTIDEIKMEFAEFILFTAPSLNVSNTYDYIEGARMMTRTLIAATAQKERKERTKNGEATECDELINIICEDSDENDSLWG